MGTREKSKFDILGRIESERLKRGWSEYTLSVNSGIPQSTISTWYRKRLQPSLASIEHICDGFGMSLSQFFATGDSDLPLEQNELLEECQKLSPQQRKSLLQFIRDIHI